MPSIGSFYSFIFLPYNRMPEKCFPALKRLLLPHFQPTGIGLGSLCEEETGAYYQLSRFTNKLGSFLIYFKVAYFAQKNTQFQKTP